MAFCDLSDLSLALGGDDVLRQLTDFEKTGQYSAVRAQAYIEDGAADVRAAAEIKHDPEVLANLDKWSARKLNIANAYMAARHAYRKGGKGLVMPPELAAACKEQEEYLDDLAAGNKRLGRVAGGSDAPINQPAIGALSFDAADSLSVATGGASNPSTGNGKGMPSTSGVSVDAYRANGFR